MLLIKVFFFIWYFIFRALMFTWPVSLVLLAILISEIEHAPKKWHGKHFLALTPLAISTVLILYVTLAIAFPPLRFVGHFLTSLGGGLFQLPQILLCAQIGTAGYALYRVKGHRCFFLSLLLVELWIGFWCSLIVSGILMRLR
jgi:hypothetical protein